MSNLNLIRRLLPPMIAVCLFSAPCSGTPLKNSEPNSVPVEKRALTTSIYIADPSAHVFDGRIYIYPSHDIENDIPSDNLGSSFDMKDYHVFSLDGFSTPLVDHGEALNIKDVPWAWKQMWAPDAAHKNGNYYLFFPAKDKAGIFRIGVAVSASPARLFKARPEPIKGSYSIDPCAFVDDDGSAYLIFGGLWGGQLQRWRNGEYKEEDRFPDGREPALGPRVARLTEDLLEFQGPDKEIAILNEDGTPLRAEQHSRRFFEAAWMHKYQGKYYLSYSTGDTRRLVYAIGDSPLGPFTYRGVLLTPVVGWTTHHSIVEFGGSWYLFYHDASLSGGRTELRCVKYAKLEMKSDGSIKTVNP
jgi:beta-xylosidase